LKLQIFRQEIQNLNKLFRLNCRTVCRFGSNIFETSAAKTVFEKLKEPLGKTLRAATNTFAFRTTCKFLL